MKKRNLFNEITEGFDALRDERHGKRTLRTHAVEPRPVIEITAPNLSRFVSACNFLDQCLRITFELIRVRSRTGSRVEPNPMLRQHC
jgi:hypothetical protein